MKTSREELVSIAFKSFVTKGYDHTSMVDLARAAGVSKGAFHHYFARKSELLEASLAYFFEEFLAANEADHGLSFADFARQSAAAYAQALVRLLEHDIPLPAYQAFMWSLARDEPEAYAQRQTQFLMDAQQVLKNRHSGMPAEKVQATAQRLFALIEGIGVSISLEIAPKPEDISRRFDREIAHFLDRVELD